MLLIDFGALFNLQEMTLSDKTRLQTMSNQRRKRQPKPDIQRTRAPPKPFSFFWPSPSLTRKALVTRVVALAVGLILWFKGSQTGLGHYTSIAVDWNERKEEVKEAFVSSWDAYSEHAWGKLSIVILVLPALSGSYLTQRKY